MRLVSLDNVNPENRLAKNIYDENGHVLLAGGNMLKEEYVERLRKMGITSVYIEEETIAPLEVEDIVSEGIRLQVKRITKDALNRVKSGHDVEVKKIQQAINEIMDEVIRNRNMLVHLTEIRSQNDATFSHSVNVCILSLLTGVALGYNQLKLKDLGVGALLHDLGKAVLPDNIVKSTKALSGSDKMKLQQHTDLGFDLLRKTDNVSAVSAHVAWEHHECFDGTGIPRGIKGQEIHEFGRIVAVANLYDNLTSAGLSKERILPHEAVEIIQGCQGRELDPDITKVFIQNIAPYPVGSRVILNSGSKGVVVEVRKELPTRPKVKLLFDENGMEMLEPITVDLVDEHTVFISEVEKE